MVQLNFRQERPLADSQPDRQQGGILSAELPRASTYLPFNPNPPPFPSKEERGGGSDDPEIKYSFKI